MEEWRTWTNEELERQVSPSRWNPKSNPDDVINQYFAICNEETQKARQRIPHELNISYGTESSASQKYDLYGTDLADNAVIFVWIHGGYWQEGSKDISATMAQNLYSIGVKTAVLGYTLAPKSTLYEIQKELIQALKHVLKKFREANCIVGGHSAGAQLAAMLLHSQNFDEEELGVKERLIGLALISGMYDLRPLVDTYVNDALKLTAHDAENISPLLQTFNAMGFNKDMPILLCMGQNESPEFKRQTMGYTKKLQEKFSKVKHWVSESDDHFTIIERLADLSESSPGRVFLDYIKSTTKL